MKHVISKSLLLVATVLSFSACNKGGGDGGGGQQQAQVPTVPGPLGNVYAQNDQNTYCTFTNGALVCYQVRQGMSTCSTNTMNYTDIPTMCSHLQQLQNSGGTYNPNGCQIYSAVTQALTQYCANQNNGGGTVMPNTNINLTGPHILCDFEAYATSQGRWLRRETRIPKLTAGFGLLSSTSSASFNLNSSFLGIGPFGNTTLSYKPAILGKKGTADTITLSNQGLLGKGSGLTQSGFAGQTVSMEVMSDDGNMKMVVSCSGQGATFKKNVAVKAFTQYVCRGKASLYGSRLETIEASFPYNQSLLNSELNLAENLTASITGDTGSDNARITFTAHGVGFNVSLQSSAYLKTTTQLSGTDGYTTLNLTCGPQ